jgi:hypothetical protein
LGPQHGKFIGQREQWWQQHLQFQRHRADYCWELQFPMANGAIRNLVRPIEPKRPSRRQCGHADADADTNSNRYSHSNTYFNSYTCFNSNPDSNSCSDIDSNRGAESGSSSNGEPCARSDLYWFDRYLSVDRG